MRLPLLLLAGCLIDGARYRERLAELEGQDPGPGTPPTEDTGTPPTGPTGDTGTVPVDVDADQDGYEAGEDCDDSDPDVHPGAADLPNAVDDDCDGIVDGEVVLSEVDTVLLPVFSIPMEVHVTRLPGDALDDVVVTGWWQGYAYVFDTAPTGGLPALWTATVGGGEKLEGLVIDPDIHAPDVTIHGIEGTSQALETWLYDPTNDPVDTLAGSVPGVDAEFVRVVDCDGDGTRELAVTVGYFGELSFVDVSALTPALIETVAAGDGSSGLEVWPAPTPSLVIPAEGALHVVRLDSCSSTDVQATITSLTSFDGQPIGNLTDAAIADLDEDGALDVAATVESGHVLAWRGQGTSLAPLVSVSLASWGGCGARALTAADWNGDDHVDLAVGCETEERLGFVMNDGTGALVATNVLEAPGDPTEMERIQLPGDDAADLVVIDASIDALYVLERTSP